MEILPAGEADRPWVADLCRRAFGSAEVAAGGRLRRPDLLPGLIAWEGGHRLGALAFEVEAGAAEVVLLAADPPGRGAGTALLAALEALGAVAGLAPAVAAHHQRQRPGALASTSGAAGTWWRCTATR